MILRPEMPFSNFPFGLKGVTVFLIGMIVFSVVASVQSVTSATRQLENYHKIRQQTSSARVLQHALSDSQIAVLDAAFVLDRIKLTPYYDGIKAIEELKPQIAELDRYFADTGRPALAINRAKIDKLLEHWASLVQMIQDNQRNPARDYIATRVIDISTLYSQVRDDSQLYWQELRSASSELQASNENGQVISNVLQISTGFWSILGVLLVYRMSKAEARGRTEAKLAADASRTQMAQLFQMADMLQSASGQLDANAVLKVTSERLLPNTAGALYVFNNSRDRLDRSTTFGPPSELWDAPESISPTQCWALKRGKPHLNDMQAGSLCCDHHASSDSAVLEIPMTARGELLGLLQVSPGADRTEVQQEEDREIAMAIADGMSLALSNIALREKLRGQALRDPLTGLYNRRYMEDSLDRLSRLAKREKKNLSLLMIDLDHFKKLNDTHGHAMGDTVLREVAAAILGCLRESDVGCRYGGEELLVILPDCSMEDAAEKAESIRARIQDLSGQHGASISASLGISSMPETAMQMSDLISSADAALYAAKSNGRNCVVRAEPARTKTTPPDSETKPESTETVPSVALVVAAE